MRDHVDRANRFLGRGRPREALLVRRPPEGIANNHEVQASVAAKVDSLYIEAHALSKSEMDPPRSRPPGRSISREKRRFPRISRAREDSANFSGLQRFTVRSSETLKLYILAVSKSASSISRTNTNTRANCLPAYTYLLRSSRHIFET